MTELRERIRSMIEYLSPRARDDDWLAYARAWRDGSMMAGKFVDPVTGHAATPRSFVEHCYVATVCAAHRAEASEYSRARVFEDAAWAILHVETGETARCEAALQRIRENLKRGVTQHG